MPSRLRIVLAVVMVAVLGVSGAAPTGSAQPEDNLAEDSLAEDSLAVRFDAANTAYEQGRYEVATKRYRMLLDRGHASGALYYNLGNAYFRLGQWGQAIRYYEKARRLLGDAPRLMHSLEQARRRAGVYPDALPPRGLAGVVEGWSVLALFMAGLLCVGGGGVVAVLWTRPGSNPPWRHPAVWGPLVAGGLLAAVAMGVSAVQAGQQRAVVVVDRAPVHRAPTANAPTDTALIEGTLLKVQRRQDGWVAVRGANGATGWVQTDALGDI